MLRIGIKGYLITRVDNKLKIQFNFKPMENKKNDKTVKSKYFM